jgi:ribonucleoside-diphosphate reductase alpha chain
MGLAHALYLRGHAFASPEAVEFNDEAMEAIAYYAYEASSDLAAERGTYSTYKGSKWDRGLLPQDTLDLLERERGVPVEVPRGGRMDWSPLREKIAAAGHAQLELPRDRTDGHDLEHHRHLALHRADLQEPVRQIEPLG